VWRLSTTAYRGGDRYVKRDSTLLHYRGRNALGSTAMAASRRQVVDPVLEQVAELLDRRRSQAELAEEIGVKRATLASWLADRRAVLNGEEPKQSARAFDYTRQPARVQELIARALARPQHQLHELSARASTMRGRDHTPLPPDLETAGLPTVGEPVAGVMAREFSSVALADTTWIARDAHRVAQIVEEVEEVAAVFPVLFDRGARYRIPYHHQLAIFMRPGFDVRSVEKTIEQKLDERDVAANWEHSGLWPKATLQLQDGEQPLLGSLIVPFHEAARAPEVAGVLPPPAPQVRLVTVLSSEYGGSKPVGGWLARATGAGLIEGEEAARMRVASALRRRAFIDDAASDREMGWMNEILVYLLRHAGGAPGAWCLTTETRYLVGYEPLADVFETTPDPLVVLHQGAAWRRMSAWRLATTQWDEQHRGAPGRVIRPNAESAMKPQVTPEEKTALAEISALAVTTRARLEEWERQLERLVTKRAAAGLPTVSVTIKGLPREFPWVRVAHGKVEWGTGDPGADMEVDYLDAVDIMLDVWTEAAAQALTGLLSLAQADEAEVVALFKQSSVLRQALARTRRSLLSLQTFGTLDPS
jgi:hypothetical protein